MGQFRFWLKIQQEQGKILDIIVIILAKYIYSQMD